MEARNRTLFDWLTRVRTRQLMLPRFQRNEAWGHQEVGDLLSTVLRGLPAGAVLILEIGDQIPFVCRPIVGAPETGERVSELLLDGQQRLTALWRSLTNNYSDRTYFVELLPENGAFREQIMPVPRWQKREQLFPLWANSPQDCWQRRLIPVHLLNPDPLTEAAVGQWSNAAANGDPNIILVIQLTIQRLRTSFATFNLPFLSLPIGTPREVALDVFVKMNTRTVSLTTFDIIVAQTEEITGQPLHDLVEGIIHKMPSLTAYEENPEDLILSVAALLQDRAPNQSGYGGLDLPKMVKDWPLIERGIAKAIEFLEQERVLDGQRLPTESVLAPLMALWSNAPEQPDALGNTRILLRKYMWRAFFTNRYERAAATAALQDFRALRGVINGKASESAVPCFDELQHPLPDPDALIQASWPKRRDRLARAILLLSLRGLALDIADGAPVSREHLKQREYHHLFPVAYLRDQQVPEQKVYRALNCALISWRTNRTIQAKEPVAYLKERTDANRLGEAEIRRRLASHNVSLDLMLNVTYDEFIERRAEIGTTAMHSLCKGEPWSPTI